MRDSEFARFLSKSGKNSGTAWQNPPAFDLDQMRDPVLPEHVLAHCQGGAWYCSRLISGHGDAIAWECCQTRKS
jgi:hypothetical protein